MVQNFAEIPRTLTRPALIHTGIYVSDKLDAWPEAARKLRLMPLSFLASQDLENTKLFFWANVDRTHPLIQEIFGPILQQYGKHIEIKKFNAAEEAKKIALHYASNETAAKVTAELVNIFESQRLVPSKSDLMRAFLLYNYGGAWMDSDVLLVQSLAPLLEEDWVVYIRKDFINPASLSASRPGSPFMTAWMGKILELGVHQGWAAYGPTMIRKMVDEIQNGTSVNYTLHLLPTCFLEGAARIHAHGPNEEISDHTYFFRPNPLDSLARKRNYIDPSRKPHSTFGFHWHNQWDQAIADTSVAHAAEQLYGKLLNIKLP